MNPIVRILGLHAVGEVARRLPPAQARMIMVGVAVLANLLPLAGVLTGRMSAGDVFAAYWFELWILGGFSIVRMLTATGEPRDKPGDRIARPIMFGLVFGLMVTLQAMYLVLLFGTDVTIVAAYVDRIGFLSNDEPITIGRAWLSVAVGLFLSHLIALLLGWFARGERSLCSPRLAFMQPFRRLIPLLVVMAICGSGVAVLRFLPHPAGLVLEAALVALLGAANLALEFGRTAWMERFPAIAALLQMEDPRQRSRRSGDPRRRARR